MTGRTRLVAYAVVLGLAGIGGAGLGAAVGPNPDRQADHAGGHQMAPVMTEHGHED